MEEWRVVEQGMMSLWYHLFSTGSSYLLPASLWMVVFTYVISVQSLNFSNTSVSVPTQLSVVSAVTCGGIVVYCFVCCILVTGTCSCKVCINIWSYTILSSGLFDSLSHGLLRRLIHLGLPLERKPKQLVCSLFTPEHCVIWLSRFHCTSCLLCVYIWSLFASVYLQVMLCVGKRSVLLLSRALLASV